MGTRDLRVAVVMGGISAEREISRKTGECVARTLAERVSVKPVEIFPDGSWGVPEGFVGSDLTIEHGWSGDGSLSLVEALERLQEDGVDVVFNALHGPWGEDGSVQGLFRYAGIPLTGPDVIPAAVTMDKCFTKQVLSAVGIETPPFLPLPAEPSGGWEPLLEEAEARLPLPWVIKPRRLGSSVGVVRVRGREDFLAWRSRVVPEPGEASFVESFVEGRELTCGVLEGAGGRRALPPIEIRPRTSAFFDYDAKYTAGATDELCPAPLDAEETSRVERLALRIHELFDCGPLSRTDLFLTPDGRLSVLEVNTLPGMTETSLIPLAARRAGIDLASLLEGVLTHALERDARAVRASGARPPLSRPPLSRPS